MEQFEYVLSLNLISEAIYEQEVIRQRQNNLLSETQNVQTLKFTYMQEENSHVHIWNGQEPDQDLQRTVRQNWLSGDDPDADIDQQLKSIGVDFTTSTEGPQQKINEEISELIDEIQSITNTWQNKNEQQKQKFLTEVPMLAQRIGAQLSIEYLLPHLQNLVNHKSNSPAQRTQLRVSLLTDFSKLIQFFAASETSAGYTSIREHLIPIYSDYWQEIQPEQEIQSAVSQYKQISQCLIFEDRIEIILPQLLDLLKDDSDEEKRVVGLILLDTLAEDFGQEVCSNYLIYEIVSLQEDPLYRVRKETCRNLVNISKVVQEEIFIGVLLPVFKKLCSDHIWGVRRQAVEVLPEICKLAPDDIKSGALLDIFKKFAKDQSKWVKQAATQFLGPFLISFKGLSESSTLLNFYTSMVNETIDRKSANGTTQAQQDENDLYHCAFNFPAILLTLGKQSWSSLREVYYKFVKDHRERVRRTIAYSLHEVAQLIPDPQELVAVFTIYIKDKDDIRQGVLEQLPIFISALPDRQVFILMIENVLTQRCQDWRVRIQQAKTLTAICNFMRPNQFDRFLPYFFELCTDEVAEVRLQVCKEVYVIMNNYLIDEERFANCLQQVISFKESKKYTKRQDFITMCEGIMLAENGHDLFVKWLLAPLCELQSDPIVNVRLELSQTIQKTYHIYCKQVLIQKVVQRLKIDSSRDISNPLQQIVIPEEENISQVDIESFVSEMLSQVYEQVIAK